MTSFDVFWSRYDDKFSCIIGYLNYNNYWTFEYDKEGVEVAKKLGFTMFPEFPNIDGIYNSEKLFSTFDLRIRRISQNISEEEKIELLAETKGLLQTDNIFIQRTTDLVKGR